MTEPEQISQTETEPVFPKIRDTFYITACLNLDGSLDISSEGKDVFSLAAAIEQAVDDVKQHGDACFVIECRAIRHVVDRQPSVRKIKIRK